MEFYLEALDSEERMDGENPPLGIIICRDKNKTVVEYALRTEGRPIGVATYTVVSQLPATYRDQLPSPEAIAERLRLWAAENAQEAADDPAEVAGPPPKEQQAIVKIDSRFGGRNPTPTSTSRSSPRWRR